MVHEHEGLHDEALEQIHDDRRPRPAPATTASAAGRVQPPRKIASLPEQRLFVGCEQVVAPVDGVAKGALSRVCGAVSAGQHARTGPGPVRRARSHPGTRAAPPPARGPGGCRRAGGRSGPSPPAHGRRRRSPGTTACARSRKSLAAGYRVTSPVGTVQSVASPGAGREAAPRRGCPAPRDWWSRR